MAGDRPDKAFLTEVANQHQVHTESLPVAPLPRPPPPAPPPPVQQQQVVHNIYDFPSVQNLKVVNGANLPIRFQFRQPGRPPLYRGLQGKRMAPLGNVNNKHRNVINTGVGSLLGKIKPLGVASLPNPRPCTAPNAAVAAPPTIPSLQPSGDALSKTSTISDRESAAMAREAQRRHSTSVVGPPVVPMNRPASRQRSMPTSTSMSSTFSESCSCTEVTTTASSITRLRLPIAAPPPKDAPEPVPSTPAVTDRSSNISLSAYEHMTSVSQRTPNTHHTGGPGRHKVRADLEALAEGLKNEETKKQAVEKELEALRRRQQAILQQLLPEEREELSQQLTRGTN